MQNAKQANRVHARVFSFGVGYDVNSRLLDKLSGEHFGQSRYVRPNEDIEAHVSQLYQRIGSPVMTDIKITWDVEDLPREQGAAVNRTLPQEGYDLFAGDQLVVAGRYRKPGTARVTIQGTVAGAAKSVDFPAELTEFSRDATNAFVEKLWASRRVGQIIDEIDLQGKNQELIDELIALSKRYGILTPYTSFLADENSRPHDLAAARGATSLALESLHEVTGARAVGQRQVKAEFRFQTLAPAAGLATTYDLQAGREVTVSSITPRRPENVLLAQRPLGGFRRDRPASRRRTSRGTLQSRVLRLDREVRQRRGQVPGAGRGTDARDRWRGLLVLSMTNRGPDSIPGSAFPDRAFRQPRGRS